jgi:hypothetical protein
MRSTSSSIQSVPTQPVAWSDSQPMHHGGVPLALILSEIDISSWIVFGAVESPVAS